MQTQRFAIRAELRSPFFGNPVTLDALLARQIFDETGSLETAHSQLPLTQAAGLWRASSALFEEPRRVSRGMVAGLRARHDLRPEHVAPNRKGEQPKMSDARKREFGNVANPIAGVSAAAVWWFGEGDLAEVQRLLGDLQFVGKKASAGGGEVGHIDFETIEGTDGLLDHRRMPLRPIPVELYAGDMGAIKAEAAWKPAYWKIENRSCCFVPEHHGRTRVELEAML